MGRTVVDVRHVSLDELLSFDERAYVRARCPRVESILNRRRLDSPARGEPLPVSEQLPMRFVLGGGNEGRNPHRIWVDDVNLVPPLAELARILRVGTVTDPETENVLVNLASLDPSRLRKRVNAIEVRRDGETVAGE